MKHFSVRQVHKWCLCYADMPLINSSIRRCSSGVTGYGPKEDKLMDATFTFQTRITETGVNLSELYRYWRHFNTGEKLIRSAG
jgi:hypothetical protein